MQQLLSDLSVQVSTAAQSLIEQLIDPASMQKKKAAAAMLQVIPLGCCRFVGGKISEISQSLCNHYDQPHWDPGDPDCTKGEKP